MTPKQRFYAIAKGHRTGVFYDYWSEVQKYVDRYKGAKYAGFNTEKDAKDYLISLCTVEDSSTVPSETVGADTSSASKGGSKAKVDKKQTNLPNRQRTPNFVFRLALSAKEEIELISKGVEGPLTRAIGRNLTQRSLKHVSHSLNASVVLSSYCDTQFCGNSEYEKKVMMSSNAAHLADQRNLMTPENDEENAEKATSTSRCVKCCFENTNVKSKTQCAPFGALAVPVSFSLEEDMVLASKEQGINQLMNSFDKLYSSINKDASSIVKVVNRREGDVVSKSALQTTNDIINTKYRPFPTFPIPIILRASLPGICNTEESNTAPIMLSHSDTRHTCVVYNPAVVYVDGACSNNGNVSAKGGYGVHFYQRNHMLLNCMSAFSYCAVREDAQYEEKCHSDFSFDDSDEPHLSRHRPFVSSFLAPLDIALPLPKSAKQTNNVGELMGVIAALEWSVRVAHHNLSMSVTSDGGGTRCLSASGHYSPEGCRRLDPDLVKLCDEVREYLNTVISAIPPRMLLPPSHAVLPDAVGQMTNDDEYISNTKGLQFHDYPRRHPAFQPLHIFTDSNYVIKGITQYIHKWIQNDYKRVGQHTVENIAHWKHLWSLLCLRRRLFAAGVKEQLILALRAHLLVDRWGIISPCQLSKYLQCDHTPQFGHPTRYSSGGKDGLSVEVYAGTLASPPAKGRVISEESDRDNDKNIGRQRIRKRPREDVDVMEVQIYNVDSDDSNCGTKESKEEEKNQNCESTFSDSSCNVGCDDHCTIKGKDVLFPHVNIISRDCHSGVVTNGEELLPDAFLSALLTVEKSLLIKRPLSCNVDEKTLCWARSRSKLAAIVEEYVSLDLFLEILSEEAAVEFFHVNGHSDDHGNNIADRLAVNGAKNFPRDQ